MKTAKSYNLITLLVVMVISLCCAFGTMGINNVKAANDPSLFLTTSEGLTFNYKEDNTIGAQVKDGDTVSFINKLLVDDLGIEIFVEKGLKVSVELTAKSFDANGNKYDNDGTTEFLTDVVTDFELSTDLNVDRNLKLTFGVKDNFITMQENDGAVSNKTQSHFRVENVDKTPVSVKFIFAKGDTQSAVDFYDFAIKSVNQKASLGYDANTNEFLQTFENNDGVLVKTAAPRVVIEKKFFTHTEDGYVINKINGTLYSTELSVYSLVNKPAVTSLYLTAGDEQDNANGYVTFPKKVVNPKSAFFRLESGQSSGTTTFNICRKMNNQDFILESYEVNVFDTDYASDAPKYRPYEDVADLVESFQSKLDSLTLDPDSVKNGTPHSVNLGKTINIPSLENLIVDDISSFGKLSKTYHYVTPTVDDKTTTSEKSIALNDAGLYRVYVTYTDENGKSTDSNLFYDVSLIGASNPYLVKVDGKFEEYDKDNDEHKEIYDNAINGSGAIFLFSFTIHDDAPISVNASYEQEDGFLNTKYTALDFNIVASGFTTAYTLWYNPSLTADENSNWTQILAINKASESGANGYTYEQLKAIAYDGKLSFVPDKIGSYKIECYLTSDKSFRHADNFTIVRISDEPVTVKPANYWLQENLASVIFLSVGTLCLIGIIVLLCIKPKDTVEGD